MKLQGRNLSVSMIGEAVELLQSELRQLGFLIGEEETEKQVFGKTTLEAVKGFQEKEELEVTGVVDEPTAVKADLNMFFKNHPAFEFVRSYIDAVFQDSNTQKAVAFKYVDNLIAWFDLCGVEEEISARQALAPRRYHRPVFMRSTTGDLITFSCLAVMEERGCMRALSREAPAFTGVTASVAVPPLKMHSEHNPRSFMRG